MSLLSHYQQKTIKNYQNLLEDQCIGMNIKPKVRITIGKMSIDIFLNPNLEELADCLL